MKGCKDYERFSLFWPRFYVVNVLKFEHYLTLVYSYANKQRNNQQNVVGQIVSQTFR